MNARSIAMDADHGPSRDGGGGGAGDGRETPGSKSDLLMRVVIVVAVLVALLFALKARGQDPKPSTAPAGNAHPASRMLSDSHMPNPFGQPAQASSFDTEKKIAFARSLDLAPLRDLAVQHNNRIKIIDTLAREVVGSMVNRRDYYDIRTETDGSQTRLRYDPLFTLLDMIIDPAYYLERPVVAINYLPARDAFLDRLFTHESPEWESWRRLGRLTPVQVMTHIRDVASDSKSMNDPMQRALGEAHEAVQLFGGLEQNLLMVPAASHDQPWLHLGALPADAPAAKALRDMGHAWRNGDAPSVNAAARALAIELPKLNPAVYPTTRRSIEQAYNLASPFEKGVWFYAFALLSLLLAFGTNRRWLLWAGIALLTVAVGLHAFGFAARCIIAERFAIQNQFESMTGVSLFAAAVGVVLAIVRRQAIFAAAASAVGFLVLIAATQMPIPGYNIEREAAILNTSVLLKYHVTTVLTSYGLISLGMVVSLFYLGTHYAAKLRAASAQVDALRSVRSPGGAMLAGAGGDVGAVSVAALGSTGRATTRAQVLADLDKAQMIILQLAFWTLGVGILLGAWWADHSWGRWWAFDPKELWALLTWLVYLVVIHIRVAAIRDRGLVTAWLSLLGFVVMLFCYFGVNLLLPGLHAYA